MRRGPLVAKVDVTEMITSALLFAAGFLLGLRFNFWAILFASLFFVIAYAALVLGPTDINLLTLLVLFAHLTALQGGYLLGQLVSSTRGGPPR